MTTSNQSELPNKKGKPIMLIIIAALLMVISVTATTYTCPDNSKRWCNSSNQYYTDETYVDVNNNSESYRMHWELYEGSISLVQMALVWKEVSTQANLQIQRLSSSTTTQEVLRVRRIWQLAGNQVPYNDEFESTSTTQQVRNDYANMEYVNPA